MATESSPPAKTKKLDISEGTSELDSSCDFDVATQKALEQIDLCQNEIDKLNESASEEILLVEQKFNKLRKPHQEQRNEIITRIPNFWVTAFVNHPQISAILEEDEEECLQFLKKVEVEEYEDVKSGFVIRLFFLENPFFENDCLIKEFSLALTDSELEGEPSSKSTEIKWKEGQNLVERAAKRQAAGGRKRRHFGIRTFFQWFEDNTDPQADDIAEVIKEDMWSNPLQYFLAPDMDENGIGSDDEDDEDDDDDEEDSVEVIDCDDDDDDDEDDAVDEAADEEEEADEGAGDDDEDDDAGDDDALGEQEDGA